jgi:hypothetical protein
MSLLPNDELKEKIKQKRAEIAELQPMLDWHARRGRPDGTVQHDIMRRLQKELSELLTEVQNGKQNLEGNDGQTGRIDRNSGRPDGILQQRRPKRETGTPG